MSDVNGVGSSSNVYENINSENLNKRITQETNADNDMFMQLLIAQLKNQDPTSPTDTNAFMQQISSMSMVEGITNLNTSMDGLSSTMLNSQNALQASTMVGKDVYVPENQVPVGQNGARDWVEGKVILPQDTGNVRMKVYDEKGGLLMTVDLEENDKGDVPFAWQSPSESTKVPQDPNQPYDAETNPWARVDNTKPYDAETNPYATVDVPKYGAGEYKFVAQYLDDDGVTYKDAQVLTKVPVNSVSLTNGGAGMELNTPAGTFSMSDVTEISG